MDIKKYKGLVVGAGAIGALLEAEPKRPKPASHAGALTKNKSTSLVAIVDSSQTQLALAHKLFPKAKTYTSYDQALASEQPDIVAIATPPASHYRLISKAVEAKVKMIICEKPLAPSAKEALKLEKLLKNSGTILVLNYQRRFFKLFKEIKERIKKGEFGSIQHVTCYYSNGLYNNGGHTIDALEFILDEPVVEVQGRRVGGVHPESDRNIHAMLEFKSGTRATLIALDQEAYGIHEFRIYGTKAKASITNYGYTLTTVQARPSVFNKIKQLDYLFEKRKHKEESMVQGALEDALQAYEQGEKPVSGVVNGVRCLMVLDALLKSSKESGKIIRLKE